MSTPNRHGPTLATPMLVATIGLASPAMLSAQDGGGGSRSATENGGPQAPEALAGKELRQIHPDWTGRVQAAGWYAAPGGKMVVPGTPAGSERVSLSTINLDSPRIGPYFEAAVRDGNWRLGVHAATASADDRESVATEARTIGNVPIAAGDTVQASLDYACFGAEAAWRLPVPGVLAGPRIPDLHATWEVVGGMRFHDLDIRIRAPSGRAEAGGFFADPYAGLCLTLGLVYGFTVEVRGSVGGFFSGETRSVFSREAVVAIMWQPTRAVALEGGYRISAFDLEKGDNADRFRFNGAVAGLFAGITVRF